MLGICKCENCGKINSFSLKQDVVCSCGNCVVTSEDIDDMMSKELQDEEQ